MTKTVDQAQIPGTGQKRQDSQEGNLLQRQLKKTGLSRFLGGSQDASTPEDKLASPQGAVSQSLSPTKIDLNRAEQFSEQLSEEQEHLSLLNNRRQIQGRRGRYRVTHYLGRRGLGRLYEGLQVNDNKTVIIKEFLLPGHLFNGIEIQQRKQEFERLAGINLVERTQDFRLIGAFEAVADDRENRCYLITRGKDNFNTTLREHLSQNGPMSDRQVHSVLSQILQTLEFLHSHKFRLGSANVQRGLIHKNIGLDSLLFIPCAKQDLFSDQQFFVYVTDLGIWEHLFQDPKESKSSVSPPEYQPQVDLQDLGRLGFHLLVGRDKDVLSDQSLDPRHKALWPATEESLKQFILQLLGLNGSFSTVEEARSAIPPAPPQRAIVHVPQEEPAKASKQRWKKALWIVGGVTAVGLLGGATWWGVSQWKHKKDVETQLTQAAQYPCCIQKNKLPNGKFSYGSEQNGVWHYILKSPGLVSMGKTLEKELSERIADFKLNYFPQTTLEAALNKMRGGALDFVVATVPDSANQRQLSSEFEVQPIAYDGISVFVSFSDVHRDRNLARSLGGTISFAQLRQLYTGEVKNWKALGGPNIDVKLYMPTDPKLVQVFEEKVFSGHEDDLETFRKLQRSAIVKADATKAMRDILNDFEDKDIGSIGFDSLSKVFGQCSVYPLGISGDEAQGVQALIQDNGKPVTPRSDLCDDKGSYWLNPEAFSQTAALYPLKYDVSVIYPKGGNSASPGRKFVELWRTTEGQVLLNEAGLVPLIPVQKAGAPS